MQVFPLFMTDYPVGSSEQDIISQETETALTMYEGVDQEVHVVVKIEQEKPHE